ncbi:MAG: hypothetical protein IIC53_10340 [Proteobacteria bacterium]|nr:hypothetical protein [Pseudomonadota bacterium]
MKNKVFQTFDEAVADIPDGSTIMFPGFAGVGHPRNLMAALLSQGAKGLTGVSNGSGGRDDQVDVVEDQSRGEQAHRQPFAVGGHQLEELLVVDRAVKHPGAAVTTVDEVIAETAN